LRIAVENVWYHLIDRWQLFPDDRANGHFLEGTTLRELGRYMGEVEYPAMSGALARFQNRLKTVHCNAE